MSFPTCRPRGVKGERAERLPHSAAAGFSASCGKSGKASALSAFQIPQENTSQMLGWPVRPWWWDARASALRRPAFQPQSPTARESATVLKLAVVPEGKRAASLVILYLHRPDVNQIVRPGCPGQLPRWPAAGQQDGDILPVLDEMAQLVKDLGGERPGR